MTAIDPHLMALYDSTPEAERAGRMVPVLFDWTGDLAVIRSLGIRVGSASHGIVTAELPLRCLPDLDALGVGSVELAQPVRPALDVSRGDVRADRLPPLVGPELGKGVIIGVVDTGIDYAHPAFRDAAGQTRILYVWDQRFELLKRRNKRPPQYPEEALPRDLLTPDFQRGVEYERRGINGAIRQTPVRALRCVDSPRGHGTHVAGIASGTGAPASPPVHPGVAPSANLIAVATKLGDGATVKDLVDGVRYIASRASILNMPCVINLSFASEFGAHDGTSHSERALEALLDDPGRIIVAAAGNKANDGTHATGRVRAGREEAVGITVADKDPSSQISAEIWYGWASAGERFHVRVTPPGGDPVELLQPSGKAARTYANLGTAVTIQADIGWAQNNRHRIVVTLARTGPKARIAPGTWTVTLIGRTVGSEPDAGRFQAWLLRPARNPTKPNAPPAAVFAGSHRSPRTTVAFPATVRNMIAVGSYITKPSSSRGTMSAFSSRGPTADGRPAPTLCAPGEAITSAVQSGRPLGTGPYKAMQGTSMAAPHVTGVVAVMLQADPQLKQSDVRTILTSTARRPTGTVDPEQWGAGMLNAEEAVRAAQQRAAEA